MVKQYMFQKIAILKEFSFDRIKTLSDKISFIQVDVEKFETKEKFDLIISHMETILHMVILRIIIQHTIIL